METIPLNIFKYFEFIKPDLFKNEISFFWLGNSQCFLLNIYKLLYF